MKSKGTPVPWSYYLIRCEVFASTGDGSATYSYRLRRLLFQFVLKIFYGTIVIENTHYVLPDGEPWLIPFATLIGYAMSDAAIQPTALYVRITATL